MKLPNLSDPAAVDYDEDGSVERLSRFLAEQPGPIPAPPTAARLQSMRLPNGRFLLVLDGGPVPDWSDEFGADLRDKIGAAAVVAFSGTIDVVDDDRLAVLDDEVPDEDRAIVDRIRREYAAERAELESWRHEREELRADLEMANGDAARLLDEVREWRSAMWSALDAEPGPVGTLDEIVRADRALRERAAAAIRAGAEQAAA